MIADEADQDGSKEFLVYAAVFFPFEKLQTISDKVTDIRKENALPDDALLKFSAQTAPKGFSSATHTKIKNRIFEVAAESGCKVCCYVVPHGIAKGQSHPNRLKFGVNTLLTKFDQFLKEMNSKGGIALFDRTTDYKQLEYLREAMQLGVLSEFTQQRKPLRRVVHIDNTAIGHSHLNSVTDIVVGAFRHICNEPNKDKVGPILTKALSNIMWSVADGDDIQVNERGICIRPLDIKAPNYLADVEALKTRLVEWSKN